MNIRNETMAILNQTKLSIYDLQAEEFLKSTGTTFEIEFLYTGPHFHNDTEKRDVYRFTLKNAKGELCQTFGDSLYNTRRRELALQPNLFHGPYSIEAKQLGINTMNDIKAARQHKPNAYDILACLQKYDLGTFEDFYSEFGYNDLPLSNYPDVLKTYQNCVNEYRTLCKMFTTEQLEQLAEIQ